MTCSPFQAIGTQPHYCDILPIAYGNYTITQVKHDDDTWVESTEYGIVEFGKLIVLDNVNLSQKDVHCITPGIERQI